MNELQVNISRIWALARSIEIIVSTNGEMHHQVLLQVTNPETEEETFFGLPISKPLTETHSDNYKYAAFNIGGLIPKTEYILCPNLVDTQGRIWAEGRCAEVSTVAPNHNEKGWIALFITFAVVMIIAGVCILTWYLSKRGFKKGFNLH